MVHRDVNIGSRVRWTEDQIPVLPQKDHGLGQLTSICYNFLICKMGIKCIIMGVL